MIDKTLLAQNYTKLIRQWKKAGSGSNYQKVNSRLVNALKIINAETTDGLCLLDVGCNNGLLTVAAAEKFDKAIGIDMGKDYSRKAQATKDWFNKLGLAENMVVRRCTLADYIRDGHYERDGVNTVLATQVLYHLQNDDIDQLESKFPLIKVAMFGARPDKKKSNNRLGLYTVESIQKWMSSHFATVVHKPSSKWPIIVGRAL